MKQLMKQVLAAMIGLVFLLGACAPAPASGRGPAALQNAQDGRTVQIQQPMENVLFAAQDAQATQTPLPPPTTVSSLQLTVNALFMTQQAPTNTPAAVIQMPAATEDLSGLELYPLTPAAPDLRTCTVTVIGKNGIPREYRLPDRQHTLDDLKQGDTIKIISPVNLRSGPGVSYRTLVTLRPDSLPTGATPTPNPTAQAPTKGYIITGGPVYTDLGGDIPGENPQFNVKNRIYKWWKIESLNKSISGWIVEATACGLYYYIARQ